MIIAFIYLVLAMSWASYATYRNSKLGYLGKLLYNKVLAFSVNFILFPFCVYHAFRHKKI